MRASTPLAVLFLLCANVQATPADDRVEELTRGMPAEIREFIDRRIACNHFLSEPTNDKERREKIESMVAELHCVDLHRDEAALKSKYGNNPDIISALDVSRDWHPD